MTQTNKGEIAANKLGKILKDDKKLGNYFLCCGRQQARGEVGWSLVAYFTIEMPEYLKKEAERMAKKGYEGMSVACVFGCPELA